MHSGLLRCGVPSIKYKNNFAREIRPGEFPWQVQLQFNWRYLCGGVILNRWWVLTTAHCVFMFELYSNLVIIAGTLQQDDVQIIYNVHKIILHKYFAYDLFGVKIPDHDIALVLVREPFIFNNLVSPICFPDDRHLDMDTLENCWVTGWQLKSVGRLRSPSRMPGQAHEGLDYSRSCKLLQTVVQLHRPVHQVRPLPGLGGNPHPLGGEAVHSRPNAP
ncbi:hypothetical protein chiPu_0010322 [Chiloscyllium punctatum]|uniref:Peptidase S1 domain-containing protein n=1 Tax=Chiloscyllium punctatum TaxID=137246 RepID=A0A401SN92_CHIPU|nr:hypothetical protein [Chiloscyllium punctatum]